MTRRASALITAALLLFPLLIPVSTTAGDTAWLGPDRRQWPDTEFRETKNDFAAMLLMTPDTDWQQKWNTPPDTIPRFREAKSRKVGQELVILTFFVNPKTDEHRRAHVRCSIKVTRPSITCMDGELKGDPNNVRLAPTVIKFIGEAADPLGEWVVDVEVEDVLRAAKLPLRTRFTLLGGG